MRASVLKTALLLTVATGALFNAPYQAHAQSALPPQIELALRAGALRGPNQLLIAVYNSAQAYPGLAQQIAQAAANYQPSLVSQITSAAQTGMNAGTAVPAQAAALQAAGTTATLSTGSWLAVGLGTAALVGGGAALAAGGGGGDDDTISAAQAEYLANYGLRSIGAASAYADGATGSGVTVAVVDSGIDTDNAELVGQIVAGGQNFVSGYSTSSDVEDEIGHGTWVSGVIAAKKNDTGMHGVAYEANILPVRIFSYEDSDPTTDNEPQATQADVGNALDYAVSQGVQIINGSYGFTSEIIPVNAVEAQLDAMYDATQNGVILVYAAGNSSWANPSLQGLLPYVKAANNGSGLYVNNTNNKDYSAAQSLMLTVVALDRDGTIADYSNRCGAAAAWCIAAPGSDIYTSDMSGGYDTVSGTSFAAPTVSGAVALLLDLYPSLTPAQVVNRLLTTTTTNGYSNTAIYGRGALNLVSATSFVSQARLTVGATQADTSYALEESNIRLGAAFGDGLSSSLSNVTLKAADSFDGALIGIKANSLAIQADSTNRLEDGFARFGLADKVMQFGPGNQASLSYRNVPTDSVSMNPGSTNKKSQMEGRMTMAFSAGSSLSVGYMDDPAMGFGLVARDDVRPSEMRADGAFLSPYLGFASDGVSTALTRKMGDFGALRVGSFFGSSEENEDQESFGALVEYEANPTANSRIATQVGMLSEKDTFLGSETSGAFSSNGTTTMFGGLSAKVSLTESTDLVGSYFIGFSSAEAANNSLITGFSGLQSDAFSVGLVQRDLVNEGDRLGFVINQPLRVSGGSADIRTAYTGDQAGNVYYATTQASLVPTGREIDLEAYYATNLGEDTKLNTSLMYRHQPDHVADAEADAQALVRIQHKY